MWKFPAVYFLPCGVLEGWYAHLFSHGPFLSPFKAPVSAEGLEVTVMSKIQGRFYSSYGGDHKYTLK